MNNIQKTCFFTGHRIIPAAHKDLISFLLRHYCIELIEKYGVTDFISGGALGFDTLAAQTVLELKNEYDIKLHLYLPCYDQSAKWRKTDQEIFNDILKKADEYIYTTEDKYITGCMQLRNREMARAAYHCIAYCTSKRSGTASTINIARQYGRNILLLPEIQ